MRWITLTLTTLTAGLLAIGPLQARRADAEDEIPPETGKIAGTVSGRPARYLKLGVLVYLEKVKGEFPPPKENAVMDQKGMKFVPHILPVLVGTTVEFLNSDPVAHNVFSPDGEKYNLGTWPQGEKKAYTFKQTGVYTQLCKVHPEMEGFVVVLQNPYYAFVDAEGNYEIDKVPPGTYKLVAWNERMELAGTEVTVKAGESSKSDFNLKRK